MLKSILLFILLAVFALIVVAVLFVNFAPQFGANHNAEHSAMMMDSPQYQNGIFTNYVMDM